MGKPQMVQNPRHDTIHQVINGLGPVVKSRRWRHDHGPGFGCARHVF
jgi:hypothetical protein